MSTYIRLFNANTFWFTQPSKTRKMIKKYSPNIVCLQEIPSSTQLNPSFFSFANIAESENNFRTDFSKLVRSITLSNLPLVDSGVMFKGGIKFRNRSLKPNVLWSDYDVGGKRLRVYNCHLPAFECGIVERGKILEEIVDHATSVDYLLICGDMNTFLPKKGFARRLARLRVRSDVNPALTDSGEYVDSEAKYFSEKVKSLGLKHAFSTSTPTWRLPLPFVELARKKLDWMVFRGLSIQDAEVGKYMFDHKVLFGSFQISK